MRAYTLYLIVSVCVFRCQCLIESGGGEMEMEVELLYCIINCMYMHMSCDLTHLLLYFSRLGFPRKEMEGGIPTSHLPAIPTFIISHFRYRDYFIR